MQANRANHKDSRHATKRLHDYLVCNVLENCQLLQRKYFGVAIPLTLFNALYGKQTQF